MSHWYTLVINTKSGKFNYIAGGIVITIDNIDVLRVQCIRSTFFQDICYINNDKSVDSHILSFDLYKIPIGIKSHDFADRISECIIVESFNMSNAIFNNDNNITIMNESGSYIIFSTHENTHNNKDERLSYYFSCPTITHKRTTQQNAL